MFLISGYSDYNIIGIIILSIIYFNIKNNNKKIKFGDKLYLFFIISTLFVMVFDIFLDMISGSSGYLLREIHIILTLIYYILNPLPYMAWSLYADFYIHKSIRRSKRILPIVSIPAIISIILCVLSVFNNKVFFIDENNIYRRGDLFLVNALIYYVYSLGTYIEIVRKRKNIRKKDCYSLISFAILPIIGGLIQIVNTSRAFVWLFISLSALIIYLNIQNSEINEDYLTGLYNRRQLDRYLKNSIREIKKEDIIFMIMIDINYFKKINDTYGHIEGDRALKHTAKILTDTFRSEDFISRYAGDEFVVIVKLEEDNSKEIIKRLKNNFKEFNKANITPYDISISLGYDIYNPEFKMDADEFIIHIDKLMYKDKKRTKKRLGLST